MAESAVPIQGLIYDFDGVIADSEVLSNLAIAEAVTSLGLPTTLEESLARYMGKRWPEVVAAIEAGLGAKLLPEFPATLQAATLARFRSSLSEVPGAASFIREFEFLPHCIASSSTKERLAVSLEVLGLADQFEGRVFSADLVARGKPHPDIFLFAAERIGVAPGNVLVIEDSPSGIQAARAAGMRVVGLCAGSHCRPGHAERLIAAGADGVASTWVEVARFLTGLIHYSSNITDIVRSSVIAQNPPSGSVSP